MTGVSPVVTSIVRCLPYVRCIGTTALRCGRWSLVAENSMATVPGMSSSTTVYCNTPGSPSIIVGIIIDLVGCAAPPTPFWGHHLAVNTYTTETRIAQLLLPFDTCSFSNQRLSCSTVHNQVSRRDFRGLFIPLPMPRPRRTGHSR